MRVIVSMSSMIVIMGLVVMTHCTIVNRHMREMETSKGLVLAMDYAVDRLQDQYMQMDVDGIDQSEVLETIMASFCTSLQSVTGTDGEIDVRVVYADFNKGFFDIVIEEQFDYGLAGKKGSVKCERAVYIDNEGGSYV